MSKLTTTLHGKHILFADNDALLQHTIVPHLEKAGVVVTVCLSGIELQRFLVTRAHAFDAVIVDLWDMGTQEARFIPDRDIPALVMAYEILPFIIFSSESHQAQQYEEAGVRGYVLKIDTAQGVLKALKFILLDGDAMYYSPSVEFTYRLSRRERQVLTLFAKGLSARQVAQRLMLAESTIETFSIRIRQKLGAQNIVEAVAIALREGLIR
jgi:DNA-binding NarL/FixJ family response regulator